MTINNLILCVLLGLSLLTTILCGITFYYSQKKHLMENVDSTLYAVATLAREMLPADYHDRIVGPESVSDNEFQSIVDRNNRLCSSLGLGYIWSLMLVDGTIVFTSSTSPDKVTANRKHARFFEPHSNPEIYTSTFESMRTTYKSVHDKWGDNRIVLIPSRDAHGRKYLFGASFRLDAINRNLGTIVWNSLRLGVVMFALSILVGTWLAHMVTRPFSQLTATIQKIAAGHSTLQAEENGTYEQATLAYHFNRMNQALQRKLSESESVRMRLIDAHAAERDQAEESRVLSAQRYAELLNFAVDGILIGSPDGVVIEANECICALFGQTRSELLGKHVSELPFKPESVIQKPFRTDLLQAGETVISERTIRRPDGSEIIIEMHSKKMADNTYQSIYHDITERKRTEAALIEIRRMLEYSQSAAKLGSWKYEAATGCITWTDEVYRIYGVGKDYDTSNLDTDIGFFIPEHRPVIKQAFVRAVEEGVPYDVDLEFVRPDGQHIWVCASGRPVVIDGRVSRVDGFLMEITERKKAEEKLKQSQQELARQYEIVTALLHNLSVGVLMVEAPSGKPLAANQAACELLGRRVLPGASDQSLEESYVTYKVGSRTRYPVDEMPILLGMQGVSAHVDDLVVVRPDGTERLLEIYGAPIKDAQGTVWASLVSFSDITERKRTEQALRDSEDRYRLLFEMESDALFLIDNETGNILDANQSATTLYGYTRDELRAMRNSDLSAEPEQTNQATKEATKEAAQTPPALIRIALRRHRKRDGSIVPVEIMARTFLMNGRNVHIAAVRDITERHKAQEMLLSWGSILEQRVAERTAESEQRLHQLQRSTVQLIRAEENERKRIADILHEDLQQTLVAARMMLSAAVEQASRAVATEALERVEELILKSILLTRGLVQTIAVPSAKEGDLPAAILWIEQQMQAKFGLKVELTVGEGVESVSENVYLCLFRALQEILFNVVKHAHVLDARVMLDAAGGGAVRVTVSDCGRGFPDGGNTGALKPDAGVGLSGIRERIEGLGGHMDIVSAKGVGTTIVMTVPTHETTPPPA